MTYLPLDGLDLAALMCSRVCHDMINPVGALINGLEVLEGDSDAEMRAVALELVKKSAAAASAKLQFCRLAYGSAGSAGAVIDLGEAEKVARGLLSDERTRLDWTADRVLMPKNKVKLILNLCVVGAAAIPRGGSVCVVADSSADRIAVIAAGHNANLADKQRDYLAGIGDPATVDARGIQALYTGLLAKAAGMLLNVMQSEARVTIEAEPLALATIAEAAA
jgi:histidine phosphotransferase ChpT